MKMDGDIRVGTEVQYKEIYNNLKNNEVIEDFHELFFICACIGYKNSKMSNFKKREDRFFSKTITPIEWASYYSMILEKNNLNYDTIQNDKEVLQVIERYANGGMEIILDDFLNDYIIPSTRNTEPKLLPELKKRIPKDFLHYIFSLSQDVYCE